MRSTRRDDGVESPPLGFSRNVAFTFQREADASKARTVGIEGLVVRVFSNGFRRGHSILFGDSDASMVVCFSMLLDVSLLASSAVSD